MKTLATEFKNGEFTHKLVKRQGDVAIYWRKATHHAEAHYEVIVVQKHLAWQIAGKPVPPHEAYPPSKAWGTFGWTYNDLPSAEKRFQDVQERIATTKQKDHP